MALPWRVLMVRFVVFAVLRKERTAIEAWMWTCQAAEMYTRNIGSKS